MAAAASIQLPALRFWRRERGFTQERLADEIAMRRNTIWLIETGHPTRVRTARLLATVLDVNVADLTRQHMRR
jgi:DNA-binding XRE family transcriptional regulator